jgi:hypothetical protein
VGGKNFLVYCVVAIVPGSHGIQAKLVQAFDVTTDEYCFIGDWGGALHGGGLQAADENDSAIGEHMLQGDMFGGKIVAAELGFLHEEKFMFIAARDFDGVTFSKWNCHQGNHNSLPGWKSSLSARKTPGKDCR